MATSLAARAQDILAKEAEVKELKQQVDETASKRKRLERQLQDATQEMQMLRQQLQNGDGDRQLLQQQLDGIDARRQLVRQELLALQQELSALQQQVAVLQQEKLLMQQQQAASAAAATAVDATQSLNQLMGPLLGLLLDIFNELKVRTIYLRGNASTQYKYSSSQATQQRDPAFKKGLIKTYGCEDPQQQGTLLCMALGKHVHKELVCGTHLFKYRWRNDVKHVLGFSNINDPANGLLFIKPVEEAFDNGYMCIIWDGRPGAERIQGVYRMHWLGRAELLVQDFKRYPWRTNEKLLPDYQAKVRELTNESGASLKFSDLHGKTLTFNTDARPFRRCLVFQARFAAKQALAEGRVDEQQLAEMAPYLVSVSPQTSNIEMYWQKMPDDGPDPPQDCAPVQDYVYDDGDLSDGVEA